MQSYGKLILTQPNGQEKEFALNDADISLGRATINDIALRDPKVSRQHARIECNASGVTVIDLGAANGTRVNGVRVERATLKPGDVIALGDSTLSFDLGAVTDAPEIQAINSDAELDATLAHATMAMTLANKQTPRVAVRAGGRTWEATFAQDALAIGRDASNDIALDDPKSSRKHARIERRGDAFVLRDLKSTNGTWVGAERIEEHALNDGDAIRIGSAQLTFKRGFATQDLTMANAATFIETPGAKGARRPVVIVPGLMGSELYRGTERVWPNARFLFTNPEAFIYSEQNKFEPRGIVQDVVLVPNVIKLEQYSRLGDYLEEELGYERGKNLFEFAYDWRQDVRISARQLAAKIETWGIKPPLILIGHSLGCLVSRYFVEHAGGKKKVERLLLVGGPHYGVPQILPGLLYGEGLLPFGILGERLRTAIISFPSSYQILPTFRCVYDQNDAAIDVLEDERWISEKQRPLLRIAREFRKELGTRSSVPTVSIFGYGLKTTTRVNVQRNAEGMWRDVEFVSGEAGDDTIPDNSTVMENSEIHPVEQHHGSLYVDNDVKIRLKLELTR
ncbi:MAG: FHA domain-containing protein [Chloroflexi bacterium]|nr:FHA domain-containing protein [Chloroflexota bacterium]